MHSADYAVAQWYGHQLTKKVETKSLTNFFSYTNSSATFSSTSSVNSLITF